MDDVRTHQSLYDLLEVSPQASPETIRAAYKSLVQRHHPDRHAARASAEAMTKRLNAAYGVLSDPAARARHDAALGGPTASPMPAERAHRRRWPLLAVLALLLLLLGIAAGWHFARPIPGGLIGVGTISLAGIAEPLEVQIDLDSIRRTGEQAQLIMSFRTVHGRPFGLQGEQILGSTQVVTYDCMQRRFQTTQVRLRLVDGTSVQLPDSFGAVATRSAHDAALAHACAPWWRTWRR